MRKTALTAVAISIVALAGCAGGGNDNTVAAADEPTTTEPTTTTLAISDDPVEALEDVHRVCTSTENISKLYIAAEDLVLPLYRRIPADMAKEKGVTVGQVLSNLAGAMVTYEDGALSIGGAYTQDEDNDADEDWLTVPGAVAGAASSCIFEGLDVPRVVRDHIESTRSMDGQQTDGYDGYSLRWTYHPDSGMNMTIWVED